MERNYKEDQANEIEALDSIYYGQFEVLQEEPFHRFKIPIQTIEYDPEVDTEMLSCNLVFTYTEKYPDTAPLVEIEDAENITSDFEQDLLEHIQKTIEENIGIEMIFSLVSSAQEWLNVAYDEMKTKKENEAEVAKAKKDEEDRKKFEGTRVSVETFMTWKTKFEQEFGIAERREKQMAEGRKLTGRELFLCDTTLNESDLKFLMDAGESIESVKIDESLFQNIDDLDLDDDEEDDPDYTPE